MLSNSLALFSLLAPLTLARAPRTSHFQKFVAARERFRYQAPPISAQSPIANRRFTNTPVLLLSIPAGAGPARPHLFRRLPPEPLPSSILRGPVIPSLPGAFHSIPFEKRAAPQPAYCTSYLPQPQQFRRGGAGVRGARSHYFFTRLSNTTVSRSRMKT